MGVCQSLAGLVLDAHMDYVHFNPVKHGHVAHPGDWPYSSFHACVARGMYPIDWGGGTDEIIAAGERLAG